MLSFLLSPHTNKSRRKSIKNGIKNSEKIEFNLEQKKELFFKITESKLLKR